jgi:hypothetical protein
MAFVNRPAVDKKLNMQESLYYLHRIIMIEMINGGAVKVNTCETVKVDFTTPGVLYF